MHDSKIIDGCLGIFEPKLQVGDIQKMFFQAMDQGPFICPLRELQHYEQNVGGSTVKETNETVEKRFERCWC